MEKISITRALNELKLLDKRITKKTANGTFMGIEVGGVQQYPNFSPVEDYNSVVDLIERRGSIKGAIMNSNATTDVTIGGNTMKVVDAIEMKNSIKYYKDLLSKLKSEARQTRAQIAEGNEDVFNRLDRLLVANFGKESKSKDSEYEAIAKPFLAKNEYVEADPLGINDKIEDLEEFIDNFESEVDFVLSESNAVTMIQV